MRGQDWSEAFCDIIIWITMRVIALSCIYFQRGRKEANKLIQVDDDSGTGQKISNRVVVSVNAAVLLLDKMIID